jgi:hypothetical protein
MIWRFNDYFIKTIRKKNNIALFCMCIIPVAGILYVLRKAKMLRKYWQKYNQRYEHRRNRRLARRTCAKSDKDKVT